MSKIKKMPAKKNKATVGRKRDESLDSQIIEAALDTLGEIGFDSMTMDIVAARAKTTKATVYRRWASKAELVRDALIQMSRSSMDIDQLPDTGKLRSDLIALVKPYSNEHSERKIRVLAGLGSFFSAHKSLALEATSGIFDPWVEANRKVMKLAMERKEISQHADLDLACEVIIAMTSFRTRDMGKSFGRTEYGALLDKIILPALKGATNRGG